MNKNKPQGYCIRQKYNRYLSKMGYRDVWARELLNGMFEIDDMNCFGEKPFCVESDTFLSRFELFQEINNG